LKRKYGYGQNPSSPPGSPSSISSSDKEESRENREGDLERFSNILLDKMKTQDSLENAQEILKQGLSHYAE